MAKQFGPTYKTLAGAQKRLAFERAMNPGEYARGDVAHRYEYAVAPVEGGFRLTRTHAMADALSA
jgi:hypothetical protein